MLVAYDNPQRPAFFIQVTQVSVGLHRQLTPLGE